MAGSVSLGSRLVVPERTYLSANIPRTGRTSTLSLTGEHRSVVAHLNAHRMESNRPVLPSLDGSSVGTTVPNVTGLAAGYDLTWALGAATDKAVPKQTDRSELTVVSKTRTDPSWGDVKARLA